MSHIKKVKPSVTKPSSPNLYGGNGGNGTGEGCIPIR